MRVGLPWVDLKTPEVDPNNLTTSGPGWASKRIQTRLPRGSSGRTGYRFIRVYPVYPASSGDNGREGRRASRARRSATVCKRNHMGPYEGPGVITLLID